MNHLPPPAGSPCATSCLSCRIPTVPAPYSRPLFWRAIPPPAVARRRPYPCFLDPPCPLRFAIRIHGLAYRPAGCGCPCCAQCSTPCRPAAAAPCSRRPGRPPDGLPTGGGNWMSVDRRWRYPAQNLHPPHPDAHRLGNLRAVASPLVFWRTIHATFNSSSFVATLTFLLPICRHFRRASGSPPHTGTSARGCPRPWAAAPARPRPPASPTARSPHTTAGAPAPPHYHFR